MSPRPTRLLGRYIALRNARERLDLSFGGGHHGGGGGGPVTPTPTDPPTSPLFDYIVASDGTYFITQDGDYFSAGV